MSYYDDLQIEKEEIIERLSSFVCYECQSALEDCHCADRCRDCGGTCVLVSEGDFWHCQTCGELHEADHE
jgi:hypothetical protein